MITTHATKKTLALLPVLALFAAPAALAQDVGYVPGVLGDPILAPLEGTVDDIAAPADFSPDVGTQVDPTTLYPYSAQCKLEMKWVSADPAAAAVDLEIEATGFLVDSGFVLTAYENVYDGGLGAIANEITVIPAAYKDGASFQPYGTCSGEVVANNGILALIKIADRPVGAITGWMGYGYLDQPPAFYANSDEERGYTFKNPSYPNDGSSYFGNNMYVREGYFDGLDYDFLNLVWINDQDLYTDQASVAGQEGSAVFSVSIPEEVSEPDALDVFEYNTGWDYVVWGVLTGLNENYTPVPAAKGSKYTRIRQLYKNQITGAINSNTPDRDLAALDFNAPSIVPEPVDSGASASSAPAVPEVQSGNSIEGFDFLIHNYSKNAFDGQVSVKVLLSEDDVIEAPAEVVSNVDGEPVAEDVVLLEKVLDFADLSGSVIDDKFQVGEPAGPLGPKDSIRVVLDDPITIPVDTVGPGGTDTTYYIGAVIEIVEEPAPDAAADNPDNNATSGWDAQEILVTPAAEMELRPGGGGSWPTDPPLLEQALDQRESADGPNFRVRNKGKGTLQYSISFEYTEPANPAVDWLSLNKLEGEVGAGLINEIQVSYTTEGPAPDSSASAADEENILDPSEPDAPYKALITVTSPNSVEPSVLTLGVELTVNAIAPVIDITILEPTPAVDEPIVEEPLAIDRETVAGEGDATDAQFEIRNVGTGLLVYTVELVDTGDGTGWLTVDPISGDLEPQENGGAVSSQIVDDFDTITVSFPGSSDLDPGVYSAEITVTDPLAVEAPDEPSVTASETIVVTLTVLGPPTIVAEPDEFNVSKFEDDNTKPSNETFQVWNGGNGTLQYQVGLDQITFTPPVEEGQEWLDIRDPQPAPTTTAGSLTDVDPALAPGVFLNPYTSTGPEDKKAFRIRFLDPAKTLPEGTYTAEIEIQPYVGPEEEPVVEEVVIEPKVVTVTLNVVAGIVTEIDPVEFIREIEEDTLAADPALPDDLLEVWNSGGGTLVYDIVDTDLATTVDATWLSVDPSSGQSSGGAKQQHAVKYDTAALAPGVYNAEIEIVKDEVNSTPDILVADNIVDVVLTVTAADPVLDVEPDAYENSVVEGNNKNDPAKLVVTNAGGGTLEYAISTDQPWLRVLENPDAIDPLGKSESNEHTVRYRAGAVELSPGVYTGTITVEQTNGGAAVQAAPVEIPVTLTVLDSGFECEPGERFDTTKQLAIGLEYYTDRDYQIIDLPVEYIGLPAILTPNDDRNLTQEAGYLNFTPPENTTLFVAYDRRATSLPDWLDTNGFSPADDGGEVTFTQTGKRIYTSLATQEYLEVWSKPVAGGVCISLGANRAPDAAGAVLSNYLVFYGTPDEPPCELGPQFQETTLSQGMEYYTDRDYTIDYLPPQFTGLPAILAPNDERNLTADSYYMTFVVDDADGDSGEPVPVFVAYDQRGAGSPPDWLTGQGFAPTGDIIQTSLASQGYLVVFSKEITEGECVNLGANKGPGAFTGIMSNYMVFFGDPELPPEPPCVLDPKFEIGILAPGAGYYTDRAYEIVSVPPELAGLAMIKTPNDDRDLAIPENYLRFPHPEAEALLPEAVEPVSVYVAYDRRATDYPLWLTSGFEKTDLIIETSLSTQGYLEVWEMMDAGAAAAEETCIRLGANRAPEAAGAVLSNYIVIYGQPGVCNLDGRFEGGEAVAGETYYTDRGYTFLTVDSDYVGMPMIKTPNDERNDTSPATGYLTFQMPQDGVVYVAFDSRANPLPAWMDDFTATGDVITTSLSSQPFLEIYGKEYAAGECVSLGANYAAPAEAPPNGIMSSYAVLIGIGGTLTP